MNEEIEYAEMLEIPVSTVNVVRKRRKKKSAHVSSLEEAASLKSTVIDAVNDRMDEDASASVLESNKEEGKLDFEGDGERIDTVRLYSTANGDGALYPEDYELNDGGRYENKALSKASKIALQVEFGLACALCGAIFLTNVFLPNSAINTFFRALNTPTEDAASKRPYSDFVLASVVSDLSDAELTLSPSGVLSFTDECCVYPAADGKVSELTKNEDGAYTVKISYSDSFTGVLHGLDAVYYTVGDTVKTNVPIGYSFGEREVQVTMYSDGILLNCFELTEENCLAWISADEE